MTPTSTLSITAGDDYVQTPDLRIISTLCGLADHWKRQWCKPRQDKIIQLLRRFTGRTMSRRNLNRHLGALERDGWIDRIRRHRRGKDGSLELHSTCYRIKRRARNAIAAIRGHFTDLLAPASRKLPFIAVPQTAHTVVQTYPIVPNQVEIAPLTAGKAAWNAMVAKLRRP